MTQTRAVSARSRQFRPHAGRLLLLLCALGVPALSHSTHAQTDTAADDDIIRVRTDLVTLPVFVTDEHGQRITNLRQNDFQLWLDGRAVPISYFAAGTTRVALLFALDASGSSRDNINQQRETALALFAQFGRDSRVALLTFAARPTLTLPFTADWPRARAAFNVAAQPNSPTAIFDAARAAIQTFAAGPTDRRERRIVILISDGLDTTSTTRPAVVVKEARAQDVSFYVIHLPLVGVRDGRLGVRRPARGFRELAVQTGGQYFLGGDVQTALAAPTSYDLAPVFRAIAADLQSQYVLGFYLDDTARMNRTHRLAVRLTSQHPRRLRVQQLRDTYDLTTGPGGQ